MTSTGTGTRKEGRARCSALPLADRDDLAQTSWLLTGANGTIGRRLRPYLRERVAHLVVVDLEAPTDPVENETAAVFDLTDPATIAPLLCGCDGVTHLAGIPVDDASTILGDDVRPPADVPQAGDMASAEFTLRFL